MMTPMAQQSTGRPYRCRPTTSGATEHRMVEGRDQSCSEVSNTMSPHWETHLPAPDLLLQGGHAWRAPTGHS